MSRDQILENVKQEMEKSILWLEDEYKRIRTGRATPSLLDQIQVEYYGSKTGLKAMANISIPESRLMVIKPFDPTSLKNIEKAILESDIGITPSNDGQVIRLHVPALSEERRKQFATLVKEKAEQSRVTIRNARRDGNKEADSDHKKDKNFTEDLVRKTKDDIQEVTKEFEAKVETTMKKKTEEVMEI